MMTTKRIELKPVTLVELCPVCGSDWTQYVAAVPGKANTFTNRCLDESCGHEWESSVASQGGVNFVRADDPLL